MDVKAAVRLSVIMLRLCEDDCGLNVVLKFFLFPTHTFNSDRTYSELISRSPVLEPNTPISGLVNSDFRVKVRVC